jgi:hypothetical protein
MKYYAKRLWDSIKVVFELINNFGHAFEHNPEAQQTSDHFREFAKGILEFIRNVAVISAIKFFATRAESWALHLVGNIGMFLIAVTVATYLTRLRFIGWKALNDSRWRKVAIPLFTSVPVVVIYAILGSFINYVVAEIVRGQLLH